jgi:hypothetical protein
MAGIQQRGEYGVAAANAAGQQNAANDIALGNAAKWKGDLALRGSILEGVGTGLGTLGKDYAKYGLFKPKDDDTIDV